LRAHVFDRPAAGAVVEAEEPSAPVAGQEEPVQPGVEEPEHGGPLEVAF